MRTHRIAAPILALAAVLTSVPEARAASPMDAAAAEALFTEGKKLVQAGDLDHGCPKLQESQRLDPTAGGALSAADCLERQNKLASSWGAFKEAEMLAREGGDRRRQEEAARRSAALSTRLAKLAIVVPPLVRVPGLVVKRDDSVVGEGSWGSALPADVGFHAIEATAPGYKPWKSGVRIENNESSASIEVQPLVKLGEEAPPAAPEPWWTTRRTVGAVVGAVGLVGVAIGSAYTAKMVSLNNQSLASCQPANITLCSASGVSLRNQAFDASHVASGTFIPGAVLVAAGIVVMAIPSASVKKADPSTAQARVLPVVGPGLAGVALQGVW